MLPVPPWHIAPFGAPAAFDVNLCTDSVLPRSIDPVRLRYAWGFVATSLPHSVRSFDFLECRMGPFPALALAAQFFNRDRPDCLLAGFALPSRAPSRVSGLGFPPPKAPAITAEDPFPPPSSGSLPGIFAKKLVFSGLPLRRCAGATKRFRGCGVSCASRVILGTSFFTRQSSSQTGACARSSQCPVPGK